MANIRQRKFRLVGERFMFRFESEVPRLAIESCSTTIDALDFIHVRFKSTDLRRTAELLILFIQFGDDASELAAVLHRRIATFPRVRDVHVVGAVQPQVLQIFRQVFPGSFQHRSRFKIQFAFNRIRNALVDVPLPTTEIFPFSE